MGEVLPAVVRGLLSAPIPQATPLLESRLPRRLGLWQHDSCPTSFLVTQIQELNRAAVGFGDLSGEDQANTASRGLGGVEGDKGIAGIEKSGSVVIDRENQFLLGEVPMHHDLRGQSSLVEFAFGAPWFHGRLSCISHQVDEHLLELIRIKHQLDVRTGNNPHSQSGLKPSNPLDDREERSFAENGWRHLGELTIRLQETIEGIGPRSNNGQSALKVLPCIRIEHGLGDLSIQTPGNRLDWRK